MKPSLVVFPILVAVSILPAVGQQQTDPQSSGSSEVRITPEPDWVDSSSWDRDAVGRKRKDLDGDVHYLLFDRQENASLNPQSRYRRVVYRFLTESGVQENSQISVTFDPEYETLEFHRLTVHRDGKALDRLGSQKIKTLQREEDLHRHLYDGRLSAVIILEDIRVGDVLEYSFTRRGANPIFGGRFMSSFSSQWSIRVDKTRYRLLWPADRKLHVKSHVFGVSPDITKTDGIEEYQWEVEGDSPVVSDDDPPSWFDLWGWVQLTEFGSWEEVADWAVGIYEIDEGLPAELTPVIEEIMSLKSDEDRALKAVRYVQDQIRYLGVEVGANSHKPYPVKTILSRRFGDCKDKTTLLCAMLRNLGFDAYPALVNTNEKGTVAEWLPTARAFDHVVVQLRMGDKTIWIDPTIRLQGGSLDELYFPRYEKTLIVSPGSRALVDIKRNGQGISSQEILERFDFQDYEGSGILRVKTIFRGREADSMRRRLAESSIASLKKQYMNFYAYSYPEVEAIDSPYFQDNREENVITSFESYHLSDFWEADEDDENDRIQGEFHARSLGTFLEKPDTRSRSMPFGLSHFRKVTHEILVDFPWPLDFEEWKEKVDSQAFRASAEVDSPDGRLRLRYAYESKNDHVTEAEFAKYIDGIETIEDATFYAFTVPKAWAETSPPPDEDEDSSSTATDDETVEPSNMIFDEKHILAAVLGAIGAAIVLILLIAIIAVIVLLKKRRPTTPPPLPPRSPK